MLADVVAIIGKRVIILRIQLQKRRNLLLLY